MKWIICIIVMVCASFAAPRVNAQVSCDDCSISEMEVMATILALNWEYRAKPVYVVNILDGTVVKAAYRDNVGPDFDWEHDAIDAWGEPLPVEPQIQAFVSQMSALLPNGGEFYFDESYAPQGIAKRTQHVASSIYDVIGDGALEISISNRIWQSQVGHWQAAINFWNSVVPVTAFQPSNIRPTARLWMADGSYALWAWDPVQMIFKRVPGSARDMNNNRVPETLADVSANGAGATYVFPGGHGGAEFIERVMDLGGFFFHGEVSSGNSLRMYCTSAGGNTICEVNIY